MGMGLSGLGATTVMLSAAKHLLIISGELVGIRGGRGAFATLSRINNNCHSESRFVGEESIC